MLGNLEIEKKQLFLFSMKNVKEMMILKLGVNLLVFKLGGATYSTFQAEHFNINTD